MNAKQLRNSILQMAIEGKLVSQDPNDEPASVLLDKIRQEKRRLVKEGKLKKKDLEETPISDDEKPFEIPESWEWCRLSSCLDVRDGTHDSPKYYNEGIPFVTSKNLINGKIDFSTCKFISEEDHRYFSERSYVENGDILFAMIGSIGNPVIVKSDREFSIKNVALFKRYLKTDTCILYFYYYFFYIQYQLRKIASGGVQSFVSLNTLRKWIFPLPPFAEQHRIVAKLEEILPMVDEYGKAQEEADKLQAELPDKLRKSILQEAIQGKLIPQDPNDEPASILLDKIRQEKKRLVKEGKLKKSELKEIPIYEDEFFADIPDSWVWTKMGNVGSWGAGATPSRGNPEYYGGDIPWLKTGELNNGIVSNSEEKITTKALDNCSLRLNKPGDVMIAMYGATIGKLGIAGKTLTTNQACCACTPHLIYNWYLFYYLMANKDAFTKLGAGGAQPNISRDKLINYPFILPPLAEQHRIVAKIEELFNELKNYE